MPEFDNWFPTSQSGTYALNVRSFGAIGDQTAHTLGGMYGTLAAAQVDYPSATSLNDTADWAAITECFKHAFKHETSPGVWVPNGSSDHRNRPVYFPAGIYIIHKTLRLESVQGTRIFGDGQGSTKIYHEMSADAGTPSTERTCLSTNGFSYNRVDGLNFSTAGGSGSVALDLNMDGGTGVGGVATVNNNSCLFIDLNFASPGGICVNIADPASPPLVGAPGVHGSMGSEMVFIHCEATDCSVGWAIGNWNALNYSFLQCGALGCTVDGIRINAGGMVTVINGHFIGNGNDVNIGAFTASLITCRTESKKFLKTGGPVFVSGCVQNYTGSDAVYVEALSGATVTLSNCQPGMGRIYGGGKITLDNCSFGGGADYVLAVAAGTAGVIKVTHGTNTSFGAEWFIDGDEVKITNVVSTGAGAAATNGIWIIHKLSSSQIELVGSTFVADTYNLTNARIAPGPRFHMRNPVTGAATDLKIAPVQARSAVETKKKDFQLLWADSGKTLDNDGATAAVTIRLPNMPSSGWQEVRGTRFTFIVLAAQTLTVEVDPTWNPTFGPSPRLLKAGGTNGTNISSNVVGNSIEIALADGVDTPTIDSVPYRWVVRSEEGTWTIAGTPA